MVLITWMRPLPPRAPAARINFRSDWAETKEAVRTTAYTMHLTLFKIDILLNSSKLPDFTPVIRLREPVDPGGARLVPKWVYTFSHRKIKRLIPGNFIFAGETH